MLLTTFLVEVAKEGAVSSPGAFVKNNEPMPEMHHDDGTRLDGDIRVIRAMLQGGMSLRDVYQRNNQLNNPVLKGKLGI